MRMNLEAGCAFVPREFWASLKVSVHLLQPECWSCIVLCLFSLALGLLSSNISSRSETIMCIITMCISVFLKTNTAHLKCICSILKLHSKLGDLTRFSHQCHQWQLIKEAWHIFFQSVITSKLSNIADCSYDMYPRWRGKKNDKVHIWRTLR